MKIVVDAIKILLNLKLYTILIIRSYKFYYVYNFIENTILESARNAGPGGVPSFGQDVRKGRRNEIDYLNGLVVNKGNEAGVATETSQAIVNLIHTIEQGQAKPNPDAVAQLAMQ